jgi:hypothetical protein
MNIFKQNIKNEIAKYENEFSKWFAYFDKESTRACLIIGAERSSEHVRELLYIYYSSKNEHFVLPEEFSSRLKLALNLNLISIDLYQILTQMRKMRNLAAHTFEDIDFVNEDFVELFRIVKLNIKKLQIWHFFLLMMQEIFLKTALELEVKLEIQEIDNEFNEFIYNDERQLFKYVLMCIIIALDSYKHLSHYKSLYENNLLEVAQVQYNEMCKRVEAMRSKI